MSTASTNTATRATGVGIGGLLTVAFIVLKLTGTITWSWWWVLAPAWIPLGVALLALIVWWIVVAIAVRREWSERRHRDRQ